MTWQVTSVDTTSGERVDSLVAEGFEWDRKLSAGAGQSCVIPLDGSGFTWLQMRELTAHWERTLVLEHDGVVVAAGLVRTRDYQNRRLYLQLTDLWGLWERRGAWNHNAPNMEVWEVTYNNVTLGTLAKRAVQRGTTGPAIPDMTLPITLPADVSGTIDATYYGYQYELAADVLDDLMSEGLDIDFQPRWVDGKLDWLMRNNPNANLWEWHVNAPDSGASGFWETSDGSRMTNNARVIGEGSGTEMLVRSDRNLDSPLPLLDRLEPRKYVKSVTQAARMADELLDLYAHPTVSWHFDVLASGSPKVQSLRLGDTVRLWFDGDPWITDGKHDRRIVRINGGMGEKVTITCQSTGGA